MLSGYLPFRIIPEEKITKNVYKKKIKIFNHFSHAAKDLVKKLLEYNPKKRIGFEQIINHSFFKDINWQEIEKKEIEPPFLPEIDKNIFKYFNTENELNEEFNAHEQKIKILNRSENPESYKNNIFDLDNSNDNNIICTESNFIENENESFILNKCDNCKYLFNKNNDNDNFYDNNVALNNYIESDLNIGIRKEDTTNFTEINDNYFPSFSFSTLEDEEEDGNKLKI